MHSRTNGCDTSSLRKPTPWLDAEVNAVARSYVACSRALPLAKQPPGDRQQQPQRQKPSQTLAALPQTPCALACRQRMALSWAASGQTCRRLPSCLAASRIPLSTANHSLCVSRRIPCVRCAQWQRRHNGNRVWQAVAEHQNIGENIYYPLV
jgi:hypothetical protein